MLARAFEHALPLLEGVLDKALRGRALHVIPKVAYYHIKPGQSHDGVWHVEGTPAEGIVASAISYLSVSDSLRGEGLQFRRAMTEEEEEVVVGQKGQVRRPCKCMKTVHTIFC